MAYLTADMGACYSCAMATVIRHRSASVIRLATDVEKRLGPGNFRPIAKKARLTNGYVGRALKGLRGMSFHVAKRIADAAGVSLDELHAYLMTRDTIAPTRPTGHKSKRKFKYRFSKNPDGLGQPLKGIDAELAKRSARHYADLAKAEVKRRSAGTGAAASGGIQSA